MNEKKGGKLILAILQEDDYEATVEELNHHQIYVTKLSSTGGFLKRRNITVMIGVEESQLDTALSILKTCAGHRQSTAYAMPSSGPYYPGSGSAVPVPTVIGGATVFVLDVDTMAKF